jgi:tetratricopeptide (TPR) repeat protein
MAYRLFDWTVRNVQLEELLPYPTAAAGPAAPGKAEATTSKPPPEQAIPGPGYTAFPWQALMYGRGDAWQRARVCIALARQQHLDVVMLSFDDPLAAPRPRPWLSAALVDDQLYLFDPGLGLPIPGPGGVGIATLQQVREDKGLLTGLEMGEKLRYAGAGADLDRLVALIDAAPEFLSRRMKLIESHLRSGQGLVLSQEPTALKERLKKCPGVSQVALWKTPLETWVFRAAFERRAEHDPELRRIRMTREDLYEGLHPLARARQLHLRGAFENQHDKEGAKAMYLKARLPDSMIAELETSVEIQQAVGLVRGRENDEEWRNRLQNQKLLAQHVKRNASYWLGLVHYDTARYAAAVDWLKNRTLDASDGSPWAAGARYNLARTYEAQGQFQAARDMLLLDKSPQKHGNLLRARQLRKQLESEGEPAAKRTEK